jgi:hypothetical protein
MVHLLLLLLPVHVLLLLVGMHLQMLLSLLELPLIGARSRTFLSRASRPSSICRTNNAIIRESHQQMSQRLSHLEERRCEMHTSMGFETPKPIVYPHLPPPAIEDPWAWYHNADDNGEDDDDDEIKEESK